MIRSKAVWIFFALAYCLLAVEGAAAEPFTVDLASGDLLKITEKSNLRKYENGRFVGLSYREVRGVLSAGRPVEAPGAVEPLLSGRFYVFEETKHDTALVAKRIEKVVPSRLSIAPDGTYRVDEDAVYPALRSFPVFPEKEPRPGGRWEAFGTRIVEPFRDEVFTRVRFYCGYEYIGTEMREGRELHVIAAQYAMRYSEGQDPPRG